MDTNELHVWYLSSWWTRSL